VIFVEFDNFRPPSFTFGCGQSFGFHSGSTQRVDRLGLVVRMVVSVHSVEDLEADAKKTADLMHRHALLGLPCHRGMAQRMRHHVGAKARCSAHGAERLVDTLDRLAVPLDQCDMRDAEPGPTPAMGEEARRDAHRRLALLGLARASGAAVEHAIL
jgi:hypothetical protein